MSTLRWRQIKRLFDQSVGMAPQQRARFLNRVCADDTDLRREIESLLSSHEKARGFIESPAAWIVSGNAGAAGEPPSDAAVGDACPSGSEIAALIPDYVLVRVCGEGGFGRVWIVRDRVGSFRAMKVIELGVLSRMGISEREIRALGTYCRNVPHHVNLVQVFHIGENPRLFYYTMELADDLNTRRPIRDELLEPYQPMTLRGLLDRGRLNTDTAVEITLRLLKGLECLHLAGVVHRDIKPANIIFVNREIKLADVSLVSPACSRMSLAGTPHYMPPDDRMDETADTYALGKVLYEMVTARNLTRFPHLPLDEQISSTKLDLAKLDEFLAQACASQGSARFAGACHMRQALLDCRFPLHDSPLLELAEQENITYEDETMAQLQKAVSEWQDDAASPGSADKPLQRERRTTKQGRGARSPQTDSAGGQQLQWALDRLLQALPWIVILILGLLLIAKLT